jgi:probable rRNA maturation factor
VAVELKCETATVRSYARRLRTDANQLLLLLALEESELSIVLTDDRGIQRLNRAFRGKNKATDVLSFPQYDDSNGHEIADGHSSASKRRRARVADVAPPPYLLGDIVISVETAIGQARALGFRPAERMRTLLIHGVLHLLGYDHERSTAEARRMFSRERELAASFGWANAGRGRQSPRLRATTVIVPGWSPAAMPVTTNVIASGSRRPRRQRALSRARIPSVLLPR